MKRKDYWEKRALQRLEESEQKTLEFEKLIKSNLDALYEGIDNDIRKLYMTYARDNGLSYADTLKYLTNDELKEFKKDLKFYVEHASNDEYRGKNKAYLQALSVRARVNRLEKFKANLAMKVEKGFAELEKQIEGHLVEQYEDEYYKRIYDTQSLKGEYSSNFSTVSDQTISSLLQYPWSGKNYSEKLWDNADKFQNALNTSLTQGLVRGLSVNTTSNLFDKAYYGDKGNGGNYYNIKRLIRTEVNFMANQATLASYEELGVEKYVYLSKLDLKVCDICRQLDKEVFDRKDAVVGVNYPPMHPIERCTTIPHVEYDEDDIPAQRAHVNPVTGKVELIDDISYKDWYKKYVMDVPDAVIVEKTMKNYLSDADQFVKYKKKLGDNIPNSVEKFQELKYNKVDEWNKTRISYKNQGIRDKIKSDSINTQLDIGKQGKHIKGHNNYKEGKSYLSIPEEEIKSLIEKYASTGDLLRDKNGKWINQEVIITDKVIGFDVDNLTGEIFETTDFKIHYGKNGVHIVPKRRVN